MRLTHGVEITPPVALLKQEQRAHPESADRPRANPNSPPQAPTLATPRRRFRLLRFQTHAEQGELHISQQTSDSSESKGLPPFD